MPKKKSRSRKSKRNDLIQFRTYGLLILTVFLIALIAGTIAFTRMSTVDIPLRSRWQVVAGLTRVEHNGITLTSTESYPMTNDSYFGAALSKYKLLDGSDYTYTITQPLPPFTQYTADMPTEWYPYIGSPKIRVQVSNPVHVTRTRSFSGWSNWYPVDDTEAYRTYTVELNDTIIKYDHHVYLVTVEMTTEARVKFIGGILGPRVDGNEWIGTCEGLPRVKEASLRVFFEFSLPT